MGFVADTAAPKSNGGFVADSPSSPSAAPVTPTPEEPSALRRGADLVSGAGRLATMATPMGVVMEGTKLGGKLTSKGAYDLGGVVTDALSSGRPNILNPYGIPVTPELAAAAGWITNFGVEAIPMFAGGGIGRMAGAKTGEALGERWMQQALQPSKVARKSGDAQEAIDFLLKADTNQMSKGGVERMTKAIDDLDDALDAAIKNAKGDVSTITVLQRQKKALDSLRYSTDQKISGPAVREEFLKFFDLPDVQGALKIPPETAQAIKRRLYQDIGERGFQRPTLEVRSPAAQGEELGKKAVAAGLNESLSRVSPEAAAINKKMGPTINARDLVQERMSSHGNKMEVGIGWLLSHPWAAPGWLLDRSPYLKALAAREAYRGTPGAVAGEVAGGTAGAVSGLPPKEQHK